MAAPGARIGQLPSRKSRYFPNTSVARYTFDTLLSWTLDSDVLTGARGLGGQTGREG